MPTVKDGWNRYLHSCIPRNAGPTQITESKAAFYAGALTFFGLSGDVIDIEDDDEAAKAYSKLREELNAFAEAQLNELRRGKM